MHITRIQWKNKTSSFELIHQSLITVIYFTFLLQSFKFQNLKPANIIESKLHILLNIFLTLLNYLLCIFVDKLPFLLFFIKYNESVLIFMILHWIFILLNIVHSLNIPMWPILDKRQALAINKSLRLIMGNNLFQEILLRTFSWW